MQRGRFIAPHDDEGHGNLELPANPKEAIPRKQALIAFTRTAAYSEFVEDRLGTLEVGKLADLAVLSQDIFKVSNDDLPKTESVATTVGCKIAYSLADPITL